MAEEKKRKKRRVRVKPQSKQPLMKAERYKALTAADGKHIRSLKAGAVSSPKIERYRRSSNG